MLFILTCKRLLILRVPHARLIFKVRSYGVNGELLQWTEDFLSNRRQRVCLKGSFSDWVDILSRVPQGSVLGPILFLVYVNGLPDSVLSNLYMFADDTSFIILLNLKMIVIFTTRPG